MSPGPVDQDAEVETIPTVLAYGRRLASLAGDGLGVVTAVVTAVGQDEHGTWFQVDDSPRYYQETIDVVVVHPTVTVTLPADEARALIRLHDERYHAVTEPIAKALGEALRESDGEGT